MKVSSFSGGQYTFNPRSCFKFTNRQPIQSSRHFKIESRIAASFRTTTTSVKRGVSDHEPLAAHTDCGKWACFLTGMRVFREFTYCYWAVSCPHFPYSTINCSNSISASFAYPAPRKWDGSRTARPFALRCRPLKRSRCRSRAPSPVPRHFTTSFIDRIERGMRF
jgi:hypothetical protein